MEWDFGVCVCGCVVGWVCGWGGGGGEGHRTACERSCWSSPCNVTVPLDHEPFKQATT